MTFPILKLFIYSSIKNDEPAGEQLVRGLSKWTNLWVRFFHRLNPNAEINSLHSCHNVIDSSIFIQTYI